MNRKSSGINRFLRKIAQNCDQWIGPVGLVLGVTCAATIGLPTGIDIAFVAKLGITANIPGHTPREQGLET